MTTSVPLEAAMRPVMVALQKQSVRDAEEVLLDGAKLREMNNQDAEDIQAVVNGQAYLLSLNQCKIRTLEMIPFLPSIEVLELQDNKLSDSSSGLELLPDRCPNVQELLLSGNQIAELTSLSFIMRMPELQNIELQMNPCTIKYPDYRQQLFAECKTLLRIDDVLRDGVKADSDAEDIEAEQLDKDVLKGSVDEEQERIERRQALSDFYEKDVFDDEEDDDDFEQDQDENMAEDYTISNSNDEDLDDPEERIEDVGGQQQQQQQQQQQNFGSSEF